MNSPAVSPAIEINRLGVDVGGTFTDLVLLVNGQLYTAKVLSTPSPELGVFEAIARVGIPENGIKVFCHGTTVATNALLERKGVPTLFLTTAGFRDVVHIGRQNRPSLYDLTQPKPDPVVERAFCWGVNERCGPQGEIEPLTEAEIQRVLHQVEQAVEQNGIRAVAVGFLFGFLYPDHERQLGQALLQRFPELHVSLSCQVAPEFREYERFSTTTIDAYLTPTLTGYLHRLAMGAIERGIPVPLIMQSSGGVAPVESTHGSTALLSGPAGGAYGAAFLSQQSGYPNVLTFDMGGTSTDVALIQDGIPQVSAQASVCGLPVLQPQIDIHTVSAGGGSLAQVVPGGGLKVGPESAGSHPGPACYGRGGLDPTVTDANLWLGYLTDGGRLGGSVCLSRTLAEKALSNVGDPLGLSIDATAVGIRTLANVHMAQALRVISVERGIDPGELALMAFGGAGPMHACALAEELGIRTILLPRACGVLSALGMALADLRRDYRRAVLRSLADPFPAWEELYQDLLAQAHRDLQNPRLAPALDLRYRGQSYELTLPFNWTEPLEGVQGRFHTLHRQRFGWQDPQLPIELIHARLQATQVLPQLPLRGEREPIAFQRPPVGTERRAWFSGHWVPVPVLDRADFTAGSQVCGPAILDLGDSTAVIHAGWQGVIDPQGTLILELIPGNGSLDRSKR